MSSSLWPPWTAAHQASLSFTISLSLLKLMSSELVMPFNHLILCCPLLLLPLIFPSTRVFSNEFTLHHVASSFIHEYSHPFLHSFFSFINSANCQLIDQSFLFHSFSSVQFSYSVVSYSLWPHESQHARLPCPSPTPRVYSNSCPLSQWCHLVISSSVVPFSCPQSLPASGSFPMSQLFAWGGQSIGVSASASLHTCSSLSAHPYSCISMHLPIYPFSIHPFIHLTQHLQSSNIIKTDCNLGIECIRNLRNKKKLYTLISGKRRDESFLQLINFLKLQMTFK